MKRHAAHWTRALQWALGVSIAAGLAVIAFATIAGNPSDTLYITVGELRSQAAELREIAHAAATERSTATYTRAQGKQLEQRIASLHGDLDKVQGERRSDDARIARRLLERLLASARALVESAESPPAARALENEFESVLAALIPLEQRTKP